MDEMNEVGEVMELPDGGAMVMDAPQAPPIDNFYENLALTLPESELTSLGADLFESIEIDIKSREKRDKYYAEGLRKTGLSEEQVQSSAFAGSSSVVHPILAEVSVDFSARAIKELFPAAGPVKINTDMTDAKTMERADLKKSYLNWQLTEQIPEFRDNLEQCLTQLPSGGSQYLKFGVDQGRPVSEFVPLDDLYLPYAASSIYSAERITHRQFLTRQEFKKKLKANIYRPLPSDEDGTAASNFLENSDPKEVTDSIQGMEEPYYNDDGLREVYEVSVMLELEAAQPPDANSDASLDEPELELRPYIVTLDKVSQEVLAIYRNWDAEDPLATKLDWIVEFKFIPWRGPYGIGIYHLAGGLATAATGALRALLDSAHVNNLPSLLRLKGSKTTGQTLELGIAKVTDIDSNAVTDDIRKLMMAIPFNPPSPVLYQLLEWCSSAARGVVATAEESIGAAGDRTPVGTTMAMVEQGSYTYSAIHARLHNSFAQLLRILCRINARFLPQFKPNPNYPVTPDLFLAHSDISPVSDPNIFSEAQRMAQMQSVMQLAADEKVQYNRVELHRRVLRLLRVRDIDALIPPPPQPITAEPIEENAAAMSGAALKAAPEQDHLAHLTGHLAYILDPILGAANPVMVNPGFKGILNHMQEHFVMFYATVDQKLQAQMQEAAAIRAQEAAQMGIPEEAMPQLMEQLMQQMQGQMQQIKQMMMQQLQQMLPVLPQALEMAEARMPPPPPDPTINITKMQVDGMIKQEEIRAEGRKVEAQMDVSAKLQELAMKHEAGQKELMLKMQELTQLRPQLAEIDRQTDIEKNELDNAQKARTETLKNHDDNNTKLLIARMQAEMDSANKITVEKARQQFELEREKASGRSGEISGSSD